MSDPPPPYEEVASSQNHGGRSTQREPQAATSSSIISTARLMPLDFNIYSESATSGDVYYMGPHQKDRQFALTLHSNSLKQAPKPFIILHDGLTGRDAAIGTSRNTWVPGSDRLFDEFIITVSPLTGGSGPSSLPIEEKLVKVDEGTYWHPVIRLRYSLPITQVTAGSYGIDSGQRQQFEWQESSSREVLSLGGKDSGWRLVDIENTAETLAVCVPNGHSLTKFFRFSFTGRARTGYHFSPTWEVMAVLTGLTTWERMNQILRRMG